MNIFVLDRNPTVCAMYHCDKHVPKMILETAQMMCTVANELGVPDVPYKSTHPKHPSTLWIGKSWSNWIWARQLASALNFEYKRRFNHEVNHKSWDVIDNLRLTDGIYRLDGIGLTPFAQAMPDEYKHEDPVVAYRNYYKHGKADILTYKYSNKPTFLGE